MTNPAPPAAPIDEPELRGQLTALTLEQKVRLLTGADFWSLHPEPAVGLRRLVVSDGPAGVRGEFWDERDTSANVPSPTLLAATWDPGRVERLGLLLAAECRRKGVDVLLAPTVNLHRTPYGGRHFECYSEDPLLTARIGAAYVRGLQGGGVGACVKHFVANDSETQRMSLDAIVDERTMRELYLAPFEWIVQQAGAWSVMAAYNRVGGAFMTESPMLRDILHDEWGFDGVTMSDWGAAHSTVPAGRGGLDLVMPGPAGPWGQSLVDAVKAGEVEESAINDKVLRLLRLAARVGALEGFEPAASVARMGDDEIRAQLRGDTTAGMVLLTNNGVLPLESSRLRRVAVIGPNAEVARTLGGGSATVYPDHVVSPLEGLRTTLPGAQVDFARGVRSSARASVAREALTQRPDGTPGVLVRFLGADGIALGREERRGGVFNWMAGLPVAGVASVQVAFRVVAHETGRYEVGGSGLGPFRISVDGELRAESVLVLPPGADIVEAIMAPPQLVVPVTIEAGEAVDVIVEHRVDNGRVLLGMPIGTILQINVEPPSAGDEAGIEQAVALAAASDVAVVVVGTTEEVESEGYDRRTLTLPGAQDELVRRVAAANPRTVVVVNSGSPVLLPWADDVAAILVAWFPGQEFGDALGDVLLGRVEPGGRLPTTWPVDEGGLPSCTPVDGVLVYDEGLRIGYRDGKRSVHFPFGFGLGYTTWQVTGLELRSVPADGEDGSVDVTVRNTGTRAGRDVVQVYLSRPDSDLERPLRWLAGFAGVEAAPGGSTTVTIPIPFRSVQHWDVGLHGWAVEPGGFTVSAGRSSADLPLSDEFQVR